ncbi:Retrotransposon protein [Nesidiocoris tenuis]|uniref:Retrotransposon protein n=1 Tax=Nesidiocoris tenuis TaxID=355587 RepID=A0ABN7AWW4_9HEMI|nr:Retrotransposon protein [Nesidiocoris tenuis]
MATSLEKAKEDLSRLRAQRSQLRRLFTNQAKLIESSLKDRNLDDIHEDFGKLDDRANRLFGLEAAVSELLFTCGEDESTITEEFDTAEEYRDKYSSLCSKRSRLLVPDRGNNISSTPVPDSKNLKLPKLVPKQYDGSLKDWIQFWAIFERIHMSDEYDDSTKFQYLIMFTTENSPARELIESFPPLPENYHKAINQLKSRFGREELLIELYVRELLKLVLIRAKENQALSLRTLYDKLETQLRALETLGVTSDKFTYFLTPLIESALPDAILKDWEKENSTRQAAKEFDGQKQEENSDKMQNLLCFLRREVESEERLALARDAFSDGVTHDTSSSSVTPKGSKRFFNAKKEVNNSQLCTAAGLINNVKPQKLNTCLFCDGSHSSDNCMKVRDRPFEEINALVREKGACFGCLKKGHSKRFCRAFVRCILCEGRHYPILCPNRKEAKSMEKRQSQVPNRVEQNLLNSNSTQVLMQTLLVKVRSEKTEILARLLFDSGSQRSYITKRLASRMSYQPIDEEKLVHMLFGGTKTEKSHNLYKLRIKNASSDYSCNFDVLDTDVICQGIPSVTQGQWMSELRDKGIEIVDTQNEPVEILVGADIAGKLMTGRKEILSCGLIAFETLIGWTLMGKVKRENSNFMTNFTMLNTNLSATELWRLDVLGIEDPVETKSKAEMAAAAQHQFNETTKILDDGRYEVELPWLEGHPPLPTNYEIAKSRLESTVKKLKLIDMVDDYENIFKEWMADGVIEEANDTEQVIGHYLPHRPVFKPNSSTPIRPVFDASAHGKGQPSLNQCLNKGPNLIELIPLVLLRFRLNRYGVIADIKRAFLQISLKEEDREFLKFLWYSNGQLKTYRHCRVVFGVNSSPFLLGAVLNHLMERCAQMVDEGKLFFSPQVIRKLRDGWYVDNAVVSVSSSQELEKFIHESTEILRQAQFELRGWENSDPSLESSTNTAVLGIRWDRKEDVLMINVPELDLGKYEDSVTRRNILSAYQQIFDPIGITSAVTLVPKVLIQKTWVSGSGWDTEVEEDIKREFIEWLTELPELRHIKIPRHVSFEERRLSLHTFCDASQNAFAAVSFLRVEREDEVLVHILAAKSRVASINRITIPRLELLAACIGARLASNIVKELNGDMEKFFWSDSTTVLAWLRRETTWGIFVTNRVNEIRYLTDVNCWRHIPGTSNPADLLSRGCSPKQLLLSKWWEGPAWLKLTPSKWPTSIPTENEEEITRECRKSVVTAVNTVEGNICSTLIEKFSSYKKIVSILGWIFHWKNKERRPGLLSPSEIDRGEKSLLRFLQSESLNGIHDKKLKRLKPILDNDGILRVKTKIMNRDDSEFFKSPIILPSDHPLVRKLVEHTHKNNHHVSGSTLMSLMREKYWILRSRKVIRRVVNKCTICRRFDSKNLQPESTFLPEERVRDAEVFEIVGTDFAGPLYCREGKVWIVIFTCAVYRAVRFDVVNSLSTDGFIMAFRRFVARNGRPKIVFSDNGTNFRGTSNLLDSIDWNEVVNSTSIEPIEWRFSPPSAPWWGGFWERMVGLMKNVLRKTLGTTTLTREELYTVLTDCEKLINSRPITYSTEDPSEPLPICPLMFLQPTQSSGLPDIDNIESVSLQKNIKHRQRIRDDLKRRFRSEYLGQLIMKPDKARPTRQPREGEIVFIGSDDQKRLDWPIAIVEKIVPGKDGTCRVVHLRTPEGRLCRPTKRLYPLEVFHTEGDSGQADAAEDADVTSDAATEASSVEGRPIKQGVATRSGRKIKLPLRFC